MSWLPWHPSFMVSKDLGDSVPTGQCLKGTCWQSAKYSFRRFGLSSVALVVKCEPSNHCRFFVNCFVAHSIMSLIVFLAFACVLKGQDSTVFWHCISVFNSVPLGAANICLQQRSCKTAGYTTLQLDGP